MGLRKGLGKAMEGLGKGIEGLGKGIEGLREAIKGLAISDFFTFPLFSSQKAISTGKWPFSASQSSNCSPNFFRALRGGNLTS